MTGTRPMLMVVQQVVPLKPITNVLAGLSLAKTFASQNVATEKSCKLEDGYACTGGSASAKDTCAKIECGNGKRET